MRAAFQKAFPETVKVIHKAAKDSKTAESNIDKRASRLAKKTGVGKPPPVVQTVQATELGVMWKSVDEVREFLENEANLFSTPEQQEKLLNTFLAQNAADFFLAVKNGDDDKKMRAQAASIAVMQVLDPTRYKKGLAERAVKQSEDVDAFRRAVVGDIDNITVTVEPEAAPTPQPEAAPETHAGD